MYLVPKRDLLPNLETSQASFAVRLFFQTEATARETILRLIMTAKLTDTTVAEQKPFRMIQTIRYVTSPSGVDVNVVRCISIIVGLAFTAAAFWKCSLQICNEIKS